MKIRAALFIVLFSTLFASCEAIGAIFKTGVWVGVLGVVFIIAIILYFVSRSKK